MVGLGNRGCGVVSKDDVSVVVGELRQIGRIQLCYADTDRFADCAPQSRASGCSRYWGDHGFLIPEAFFVVKKS